MMYSFIALEVGTWIQIYISGITYIEHGMTTQKKLYIGKFTATCVRQQAFYSKKPDTTPPTQLSKS